jgi:hypothetical protein
VDSIAEVESLRRGSRTGGNWTLACACCHLKYPLGQLPEQSTSAEPRADQLKMQGFQERVTAERWPADPGNSPNPMIPPEEASPEAIDNPVVSRSANNVAADRDGAHADNARIRGGS